MSEGRDSCVICNLHSGAIPVGLYHSCACPICGQYLIEGLPLRKLQGVDDEDDRRALKFLSAYIRQTWESTRETVKLKTVEGILQGCRSRAEVSVPRKLDNLLAHLAGRSRIAGEVLPFDQTTQFAVIGASSSQEAQVLLDHLRGLGYLEWGKSGWLITVKGWQKLEPLVERDGIPGVCFVAMWFDAELEQVWGLGIEPAINECGFVAIRIDKKEHNADINDEIIAEIKKAEFVVADFTGHRAGVYFEAGFARGLGRPVIWCCNEKDFEQTHFDTNHYSHVVWRDADDLKIKLKNRILATIPSAGAMKRPQ